MERITRTRRRLLGLLGLIVASMLIAPPVMAVTWSSSSSPLKVYDNNVAQGYAYGDFKNYNGISARSYSWQKDPRPGGSGIYVETEFRFYEPCGDGTKVEWCYSAKKQTDNTTSGSWIADYTARYLRSGASQARGTMKVCENHSWASDPCSVNVTRSFSY